MTQAPQQQEFLAPFSVPPAQLHGGISIFDGRTVTKISFAQLVDDIVRVREQLILAGLERGACVGLLGENCYEWIVHDLAVLSLECILVCFSVDEFVTKSHEELADAHDLSLLLVTRKIGNRGDHPWVIVINEKPTTAPKVRSVVKGWRLRQRVQGTDACTVIFSSGTSGQLKALVLSRAGVSVTIDALADGWKMGRNDAILVALPLSIFQQRLMVYAALRKDTEILLTDSLNLFRSFKVLRPTIVLGPPALFETIENRFHALPARQRRLLPLLSKALAIVPSKRLRNRLRRVVYRGTHETLGGRVRVLLTGSAPSRISTLEFFQSTGLSLFQAYGLAEIGFIAWNLPGENKFLSVGRPILPGSVTLSEEGEIIVSVAHPQAIGYFGIDRNEESLTFLQDGRVATGDLGRFDAEGFLYITGRKKNLILLQSGEKLHPESLEAKLATTPGVERVVVLGGGDMPWLVAVVAISPDATDEQEARIRSAVESAIDTLNQQVKPASRIDRFLITRVEFRPETGLVTRNLKLDRKAVHRFFERELLQTQAGGGHSS